MRACRTYGRECTTRCGRPVVCNGHDFVCQAQVHPGIWVIKESPLVRVVRWRARVHVGFRVVGEHCDPRGDEFPALLCSAR